MEEVVMYKCGVCGKAYDTVEACEACEAECRKTEPLVVYIMDYRPMSPDGVFEISIKTQPASEGLTPTEDKDMVVEPEWGQDEEGLRARWVLIVHESEKDILQDLGYLEGQFSAWSEDQEDKMDAATRKLYESSL